MADVFQEVEEELARDRYRALFDRYWKIGAAVIVVVLGAVGVHEYLSWRSATRAASASDALTRAQELLAEGEFAQARDAFAALADDAPEGYRVMARMGEGTSQLVAGEPVLASAAYEEAARLTDDAVLRDLAAIKAVYARADQLPLRDLQVTLEPLAEPGRPFRPAALELLGATHFASGDLAAAARIFEELSEDSQATQGIRARALESLSVVRAERAMRENDLLEGRVAEPDVPASEDEGAAPQEDETP